MSTAVPVHPATITQRTCEAVLGVSRRWWLEYLATHPEIPRASLGRNVVVLTSDWLAHVAANSTATAGDTANADAEQWSPEALLARRGLRQVAS
jgi:hypothetical protein